MKLFIAIVLFFIAIYLPDLSTSSAILVSTAAFLCAWYFDNKRIGRR